MSAPTPQHIFAAPRTTYFVFSPLRERSRAKTCELVPVTHACISMGMKITDPSRTVIADEAALLAWVKAASPGACSVYHVGHLASDRVQDTSRLAAPARAALNRIANRVMTLVEQALVIAVQQRLDDGQITYLAIKSQRHAAEPRTMRGHQPPERHRHFSRGTTRTEAYEAVQARSSSADPSSIATISVAAPRVAQ